MAQRPEPVPHRTRHETASSQRIHRAAGGSPGDAPGRLRGELPGLDRAWSRVVVAPDGDGTPRTWHLLDNGPLLEARGTPVRATLLCVHGNPTWSYLWRRVIAQAPPGWRVVAVDQLGMGFSERLLHPRTLSQRIDDLVGLTDTLGLTAPGGPPVFTLAHDWGGPISLGWAQQHLEHLGGVVLTNTAVALTQGDPGPALIRLARAPGLVARVCQQTPTFVRGTTALSAVAGTPLPKAVRDAFAAPYRTPGQRTAVADFVRDVPFEADHPSRAALERVAAGLSLLAEVPALLVWGPRDPVFAERYLQDLLERLPHADVQRYPGATHLVLEDRPEGVGVIWEWLQDRTGATEPEPDTPSDAAVPRVPILVDTSSPDRTAIVELGGPGRRSVTFGELAQRVEDVARGLAAHGVQRGDRVAVLVPPGIELTTLAYALWRLGAVVVIADAGLGLARMGAALRSAGPRHVIGIQAGLTLAAVSRVRARRLLVTPSGTELDALAVVGHGLSGAEGGLVDPRDLPADEDAAVLFTSGATGPPKGVVYTRDQLGAQVALLRDTFDLAPGERLVAAFAPFALYGPALGLSAAVPDMDVTAPHTLTAAGLAEAVAAVDATAVFAAPAALRNVVATAADLDDAGRAALEGPRLVLSAGAPVPVELLHRVRELMPAAQTQTPYGMTEALPIATHDPTALDPELDRQHAGVCVGVPLQGVELGIAALDGHGIPAEELTDEAGVVGEIVVRAAHVKDRYDRAWAQQNASDRPAGWHRTGDVGHLDADGRLWVEGRLAHVLTTPEGPVTPYPVEDAVRAVPGLADVAVVGVGPAGTQQVVVVVVPQSRLGLRARVWGAPASGDVLAEIGRAHV